jgi:UrcA family protein
MLNSTMKVRAVFIGLTAVTICSHASQPEPRRQVVHFGDLNLNNPEGTRALYTRIEHAAENVCRDFESRDLGLSRLHARCQEEAISGAVDSAHCPSLSAYYTARQGKSLRVVTPGSVSTNSLILVRAN